MNMMAVGVLLLQPKSVTPPGASSIGAVGAIVGGAVGGAGVGYISASTVSVIVAPKASSNAVCKTLLLGAEIGLSPTAAARNCVFITTFREIETLGTAIVVSCVTVLTVWAKEVAFSAATLAD